MTSSSGTTRIIVCLACALVASFAVRLYAVSAKTSATSQLRRTVEDSPRSASGSVRMRVVGTNQFLDVTIKQLFEDNFKIYITTNVSPDSSTNDFVFGVTPLDRTSEKKGTWRRNLKGSGGAPIEIPIFTDITDLSGRQIVIAQPGTDLTVAVTNLLNCATNIVGTVTNVDCTTNIVVGLPLFDVNTTSTVSAVLWAPIPDFSTTPNADSFRDQVALELPGPPNPSPNAEGLVRVRFNNATGQNVLDVRAGGLVRGQNYSVWIASDLTPSNVLVKAGNMVLKGDGASASFVRDTRFGDPLPQEVGYVSELAGRIIVILDEFEETHLIGLIPPVGP